MAKWEEDERKIWGLLLDLKKRVKELEKQNQENKNSLTQPLGRSEAESLDMGGAHW